MRVPTRRGLTALAAVALTLLLAGAPAGAEGYDGQDGPISLSTGSSPLARGESFVVTADGFEPGSTVTVTIYSDPIVLGTMVANSVGTASGSFQIPSGLHVGTHTIVAAGTGADGLPRSVELSVEVASSTTSGSAPAGLALTGGTIGGMLTAAVLLVAAGVVLLRFRRRRVGVTT